MSAAHPAFNALNTLRHEFDRIHHTAIKEHGILRLDPDSDKLAQKLQREGIAYPDSNTNSMQLHSAIIEFFRHYENRLDFQRHAGNLSNRRSELLHHAYMYTQANNITHLSHQDKQRYQQKIIESLYDITRQLQEISQTFAETIYQQLQNIPNLELRIQENKNVLAQLERLITTLDGFTVNNLPELYEQTLLKPILNNTLTPSLNKAYNTLSPAVDRFNESLMRWEKDLQNQQRNRLLDAIAQHYRENSRYTPDYDLFSEQQSHRRQPPQTLPAQANTHHPDADNHYSELASQILSAQQRKTNSQPAASPDIIDRRHSTPIIETTDPTDDALEDLFTALQRPDGITRIKASEAYHRLTPPISPDIWLLSVDLYYRRRASELSSILNIHYHESQHPKYNGNRIIHDITLSQRTVPSHHETYQPTS